MEIHELNTKALTDPAYVPFDDGTDTYKAEFNEVVENAANAAVAEADLTNNPVAFTSGDAASPTAWTNVSVITTGSTLATLFNRISTMVKNVRWLYSKLGTTDISSIGGGTVTGAISALNGKIGTIVKVITTTGTVSNLAAQSAKSITISFTIPTGYTLLMYGCVRTNSFVGGGYITSNTNAWVFNPTTATVSGTITCDALVMKA